MNDKIKSELIEKFLEEELNKGELIVFKDLLKSDPKFKSDVKHQLDVQNALKALYKSNKEIKSDTPIRRLSISKRYIYTISSLAASIALILLFGYNYIKITNKLDNANSIIQQNEIQEKDLNEKIKKLNIEISDLALVDSSVKDKRKLELEEKEKRIFELEEKLRSIRHKTNLQNNKQIAYAWVSDKIFEPYAVLTRGGNNNNQYDIAMKNYKLENYDEAIKIFEGMINTISNKDSLERIRFYYGNSCLAAAKSENSKKKEKTLNKAIQLFDNIIVDKESNFYEEAKWFLALTYLKTDKKEKCKTLLNEIIEERGYNYEKAKSILIFLE